MTDRLSSSQRPENILGEARKRRGRGQKKERQGPPQQQKRDYPNKKGGGEHFKREMVNMAFRQQQRLKYSEIMSLLLKISNVERTKSVIIL
jgi:hypothetical protein